MKKDLFSDHASIYAAFRPTYPDALYEFIFKHNASKTKAWDCATGNGQVASYLAHHFKEVKASDISQQQLDTAVKATNIFYSISPAEKTPFPDSEFDLITVGQALHWFSVNDFFNEVKRVGKQDAMLAVWGYTLCSVNPEIDILFSDYYTNIVGPYWDSARKLIENEYRDIEFPFEEIPSPKFEIQVSWTLEHYEGYLRSWSATQKYIKANDTDPLVTLLEKLKLLWKPGTARSATFPVFLRLCKITK
ncbi:MAG TPA: class I SAM-dependent methyltransferase [Chryseolinea sp.]|nr:class I SAM-dependent methyltransferase [Chryseolinea sp.]